MILGFIVGTFIGAIAGVFAIALTSVERNRHDTH
jgi:F0F1-type ATP synthase assembly protein I